MITVSSNSRTRVREFWAGGPLLGWGPRLYGDFSSPSETMGAPSLLFCKGGYDAGNSMSFVILVVAVNVRWEPFAIL